MKDALNKPIRIILGTNGIVLIAGAMLGPIYALFVEEIGGDLLDASIAFAVFALAGGITMLIAGHYTDKVVHKERIMVSGYIIMGIGFLGYLFVDSLFTLLIVQIIIGLGEAIYTPPIDTLYAKHIHEDHSGKTWALWESLDYFTAALGAIAGGYLVTLFGFDALFIAMSVLTLGSALYLYLLPKNLL